MNEDVSGGDDVCTGCTGACCLDVVVGITGYDAWRIARANGLPFDAFVTIASAEPGVPGAFRLEGDFAVLMLAKHASDARACAFLSEPRNGVRLCTTHPSRPRVCRSYPMARAGGELALRSDVVCGPRAWDLQHVTTDRWLRDLDQEASEWAEYERVVAAWNASLLDGIAAYLSFVRIAYDEIALKCLGSS